MDKYVYKKVKSITFGLLSPEMIEKMSAAKIVTAELYDKEGYPVDGGLLDTRLGVIDPGLRCKTCGAKIKECLGHFGHIELARPVVHIKYVKMVLDVLRCTCKECFKILMADKERLENIELIGKYEKRVGADGVRAKTNEIINSLKNIRKCPHCKSKQISVKVEKPTTFMEGEKRLSLNDVKARLERVSADDLKLLGVNSKFARPEWAIMTLLPIPPVTIRPSITLETGERSEDDLTHKLGDIERINQRLFENINAGAPEIIVEDLWDLLQYHVTTYFDNTVTQIPPARHRSGQALKTLTQRLKSKEGRFRHNLAGKRVNFAARTVISPDPKLKFNEVGVPNEVAMELTVPEMVTDWNIDYLKELIKKGPDVYPGANYVIRPDGKKKKISEDTKEALLAELANGFIVERHLIDGDISIFNRQPSLHRMSIMCHKVKIMPGKSFRLNPSVCNPYNADFDGDEMNLHIPQTEEARAEAEVLMQVQTQIMTPKHGYNVIGCVEDSISGNYLLTKDMKMTHKEAAELLISIGVEDVIFDKKVVDGREIFSKLLPEDFNFTAEGKNTSIVIKKGHLLEGFIDEGSIGEDKGVLLREFYRRYGEDKTLDFIGKVFRLGIATLLKRGFTTSVLDSDLPADIRVKVTEMLHDSYKKADEFIELYNKGKLEALPGKTEDETLEAKILEVLNKVRNKIGDLIRGSSNDSNHTIIMAKSGARGNMLNLAMMSACVGQQDLRGQRINKGYRGRTLSIFKKGDLGPEAHGFVKNAFKTGLSPAEFFFHAMTGRDALMDTALRTPKSGYLYRRLANALQDLKVEYDGTVRDANKNVIQFKYGEDGIDVSKSEGGTIDVKKIIIDVTGEI
ncbi:MAG TPA: DNA-directed RNA polymerase subunit A' [Candidatus Nanoarchaeia archaeon]|nr:DNA-directed RNA polymerase subunit A' [Candidatus Nanoarchaeia archaeon]